MTDYRHSAPEVLYDQPQVRLLRSTPKFGPISNRQGMVEDKPIAEDRPPSETQAGSDARVMLHFGTRRNSNSGSRPLLLFIRTVANGSYTQNSGHAQVSERSGRSGN